MSSLLDSTIFAPPLAVEDFITCRFRSGGGSSSSSSDSSKSSISNIASPKISTYATVEALLDGFNRAAAQANLSEYFGCFSSNGRFLGTDATENWTVEEFYSFSKPHFDGGKGWTYIPRPSSRKISIQSAPDGSPVFASFDEVCFPLR